MSKLIINYTSCFYTTIDQSYWLHVEVFWESTEVTTVTLKKTIINELNALLVTKLFTETERHGLYVHHNDNINTLMTANIRDLSISDT